MSPLNLRPSLDARWTRHHRSVPAGFMLATVRLSLSDDGAAVWDPDTGEVTAPVEVLWTGQARCQPNKDWRARSRVAADDPITMHALRLQIPLKDTPPIPIGTVVRVLDCPDDPDLETFVFRVRNPLNSSNPWLRNILCDVDVEEHPDGQG